jgi:hypothetical protein
MGEIPAGSRDAVGRDHNAWSRQRKEVLVGQESLLPAAFF